MEYTDSYDVSRSNSTHCVRSMNTQRITQLSVHDERITKGTTNDHISIGVEAGGSVNNSCREELKIQQRLEAENETWGK